MSPILVRPVREQLEHDRVIRLLQAKYKKKFDVAINPGHEQSAPVGGPPPWYPDLVLHTTDKVRRMAGVVEVETAESVNHLEAMSQWGAFTKLGVAFHLYVPAGSVDTAKRLCADFHIVAAEMWAYASMGDQLRFTLVHKIPDAADVKPVSTPAVKTAVKTKAPAAPVEPARKARAAAPAPAPRQTARPASGRKTPARTAARPAARPARSGASSASSRAKTTATRRTAASSTRARTTKSAARPAARKASARTPKRK